MGNTPLFCVVWVVVAGVVSAKIGGWDTAPNTQYHIQTDEGPERYFKYQTLSGQYRKEKRLEDGTVVGSYGWVDADGYLRLRDYIADSQGYRIVRTKKVLVGVDTPIGNAVSAAKKVPSQGGVGVEHAKIYERPNKPKPFSYPSSPSSTYRPELASNSLDYPPSTPRPIALGDYLKQANDADRYPSSSFAPINVPEVYITPNSYPSNYPSSTPAPTAYNPSNTPAPSAYYPSSTPAPSAYYPSNTPAPSAYYPSSTPAPSAYYPSSTPAPSAYYPSSTAAPSAYNPSNTPAPSAYYPSSTPAPSAYYPSSTPEPVRPQTFRPYLDPNSLSGYDPSGARRAYEAVGAGKYSSNGDQQPLYDGVSLTHNGFRYYLPRHYHEEETLPGDQRAGSFGYVDPFGIRRVIYYNASPGSGFVHRKNNRYVGFNSTPYDPRY